MGVFSGSRSGRCGVSTRNGSAIAATGKIMGIHIIKIPDIGEGIAEVELVEWHVGPGDTVPERSEKPTCEVHSLLRISYAVFCLKNIYQILFFSLRSFHLLTNQL